MAANENLKFRYQVTPVLFVPPPRLEPRAGNSFADNLKLLPPLIIT